MNNFAIEGGVVSISDNGYFTFNQSTFINNYAIAGSILYIFSSTIESSIVQSTISNNTFVDLSTIVDEITTS